jgi:hypothetical protein
MDLVETLKSRITALEEGKYTPGLNAVLLHIETAFRHLSRGQDLDDDTAYTDAIYRTNQAFEGSLKEAYRVLADHDPKGQRPFDIENHLEKHNVFRSRVLSQLKTYRTEWRNPSAHDYILDFDESEAFLAIVSVSAFATLLLNQITERLAFVKSQAEIKAQKSQLMATLEETTNADLQTRVADLLTQFCAMHLTLSEESTRTRQSEVQVIGALHGFFSLVAPELVVKTNARLDPERPSRADIVISRGDERVVVEIKRTFVKKYFANVLAQVEHYLLLGGIIKGVLLLLPEKSGLLERVEFPVKGIGGTVVVLAPEGSDLSFKPTASHDR